MTQIEGQLQNIRLREHKALKMGDLTRLGKINVVCGTNNSGKTTLLERIASAEKVSVTQAFLWDENIRDQLKQALNVRSANLRYGGNVQTPLHFLERSRVLDSALQASVEAFPSLFVEDSADFATFLIEKCQELARNTPNVGVEFDSIYASENIRGTLLAETTKLLAEYFEKSRNDTLSPNIVVLVTPKRNLIPLAPIQIRGDVGSDGEGLLQRLFSLKTKLPKTDEREFFETYWLAFQEVSGGMKFDIEIDNQTDSLKLYFSPVSGDVWRFAQDSGLGLRELMVMLFFALERTKRLVLIEEPENHLHPELQRRLLWFLKEKTSPDKQFILSTHSSVLLDGFFVDRIFRTSLSNGVIQIDDATSKAQLLREIGHSPADNLVSDLVIVVESSGDELALTEFLIKKGIYGKYNIRFWTLNGDAMANVDLSSFAENYSIMVLLDKDPQSESSRKSFVAHCNKLGIPVTKLKRYSLESYYPLQLYRDAFGDQIPQRVTELEDNEPVWAQLGSNLNKKAIKKGSRKFASRTDLKDIEGTDLYQFLNEVEKHLITS